MRYSKDSMKIAITGTPGTGKSSVAKLLVKKGYKGLDLNSAIKKEKLYCGYDEKRRSYIADMKKIIKFMEKYNKKNQENIIIDSHLSHLLPPRFIDIVIVLRCKPIELEKRLKKKKYIKRKIKENLEAELIGVISFEARKKHKKVYEIDTTKKSLKRICSIIQTILNGKDEKYKGIIDWLG